MTLVVLGVDALDPDLVDSDTHPNLTLKSHSEIETIASSATGSPSTHELWPTIITGLRPEDHGLQLEDGVTWENPIVNLGSRVAKGLLPDDVRSKIGAWLLNNTGESAFRTPTTYYKDRAISTIFDDVDAHAIGIPNYVVDPDEEDREHELRKNLGELFQHDPSRDGHKHTSTDPREFYELCLEMSMIRIARTRRALRRQEYELVFGYTSGLDLISHVSYDNPSLQQRAYEELDTFIGELRSDLQDGDQLVLISDHGLQNGIHTDTAMIASTRSQIPKMVSSVLDFREAVEHELKTQDHSPVPIEESGAPATKTSSQEVRDHLEDLGYM